MDNVIINGSGPQLLQLTVWFEVQFEKESTVTVQVGSRAPLTHRNYIPLAKIFFYSVASSKQMPIFLINYNQIKIPLDCSEYSEGVSSQIGSENLTLHFAYHLVSSLKTLEQKYCTIKQDEQKFARGEGLDNFIRAESQFLTLFQRHQDIEEIKVAEIEEEKYERQISNEIIKLQRSKINIKIIVLIFTMFFIFGYFFQAIERGNLWVSDRESRKGRKGRSERKREESEGKRKCTTKQK